MNENNQNYNQNWIYFNFSSNIKVRILNFGYVLAVTDTTLYIKL